jgi:hypothetical protein
MRRTFALTPFLLPLSLLAACGDDPAPPGSSPAAISGKSASELLGDADTAEQAGDWKAVLAFADGALADAKATGEEKQAAWLRKISAEAHVNGVDSAKAALEKMGAGNDVPAAGKLASLASDLVEAELAAAAVEVVAAATARYGTDPAVRKQLNRVAKMCKEKLEASGDAGSLDKLKSLGYLSTSDEDEEESADG